MMTSILFLIGHFNAITLSIEMQLSKNQKMFCRSFSPLWKSRSNLKHFEINDHCHSLCISDNVDCERRAYSNDLKVLFQKTFQQAAL